MATFKNRALTLATVGVLSGVAITLATNGVIQQKVAEPSVIVTPPVTGGWRPGRAPREWRHEYPRLYTHAAYIELTLDGETGFQHIRAPAPRDFKHTATLYVTIDGAAESWLSHLYRAQSSIALILESTTQSALEHLTTDTHGGDLVLESSTQSLYMPADGTYYADGAVVLEIAGSADVTFERARLPDEPVLAAREYVHYTDPVEFVPEGGSISAFFPGPRAFGHVGTAELEFEAWSSVDYAPVRAPEAAHWHIGYLDIGLDGGANTALYHAENRFHGHRGVFDAVVELASYTELQHDTLPAVYDEDAEILLLFAQMMGDE